MIWHPYTSQKNSQEPLKIKTAKNEFLISEHDTFYIDLVSSWWVSIHGHNHPYIREKIISSLEKLDHVILAGNVHEELIKLTRNLMEFTNFQFHKAFYSDNGSCAVDISIKMSIQYFHNQEKFDKKEVLHFSSSYHGDSIGAMSVSGKSKLNEKFDSVFFNSKEFVSPDCYNCPKNLNPDSCSLECLDEFENYVKKNHIQIASLIIEPIVQAALGMKFYKKEVLLKIQEICNYYNILFILDEVFTGFGRLGTKFAFEYAEISPDIICLAKGLTAGYLPMAVTLVNEKVYSGFYFPETEKAFLHGHTMTGNPACSASANASIELFRIENRMEDIKKIESYFQKKISLWKQKANKKFFNIRTIGTIFAFEIGNSSSDYLDKSAIELKNFAYKNQILIRPLGNTVYLTPVYPISIESLDKSFFVLEKFLEI